MNRSQTKPELQLKIKQLENKVSELQKEKNNLIEFIKSKKMSTDNIEDITIELTSNQWVDLIRNFITKVSKKCGVLNVEDILVDWLDIKPSVYHKRVLSKFKNLHKDDFYLECDPSIISKLLCIKLFISAYEDEEFHTLWRLLSKNI